MNLLLASLACRGDPEDKQSQTESSPGPLETADSATVLPTDSAAGPPENILIVMLDDIGTDKVGAYGSPHARTPVLDGLAAQGMRFDRAYSTPLCSPTRASLLTGRYGRRTGIGELVKWRESPPLPPEELGLGEMLDASPWTWDRSALGKWHVGAPTGEDLSTLTLHPSLMGFPWFAGSIENLQVTVNGGALGYYLWEKDDNGKLSLTDTYATIDTTDDAVARIAAMQEPWLAYVAYNAAHQPWEVPPDELHTYDELPETFPSDDIAAYQAMVEAVDTELGRLLTSMGESLRERTTILVMSDNGTEGSKRLPPYDPDRHKGTIYEGGIRVPMIVAGPRVASPGSSTSALVHVVDVFATVADIADVPLTGPGAPAFAGPIDGVSFLDVLADPTSPGQRDLVFSELFVPNGDPPEERFMRTLLDREWKYARNFDSVIVEEQLFRFVEGAPDEGPDLLADGLTPEEALAYERLSTEIDRIAEALLAEQPL